MLRNLTAALVATALLAGPAFAAQPSGDTAAPAAAATKAFPAAKPAEVQKPANPAKATKTVKTLTHGRSRARHHTAHVTKPGKVGKNASKSTKSAA